MNLESSLLFLEEHKEALSWLGGGLASIFGGMWIIAKFFLMKNHVGKSSPADSINPLNAANINVGGNVGGNIHVSQHIGRAVSRVSLVLALLGLVLLVVVALGSAMRMYDAQVEALPYVEVYLGCGDREEYYSSWRGTLTTEASEDELMGLDNLLQVSQKYRNQIIMASVSISAEAGGDCFRLERLPDGASSGRADDTDRAGIIELEEVKDDWAMGDVKGYFLANAYYKEWAASQGFFFPSQELVPESDLYEKSFSPRGRTILDYKGPFIVREGYDTPWGYTILHPVVSINDHLRRRLRCSDQELPWLDKLLLSCALPKPTKDPYAGGEGEEEEFN